MIFSHTLSANLKYKYSICEQKEIYYLLEKKEKRLIFQPCPQEGMGNDQEPLG